MRRKTHGEFVKEVYDLVKDEYYVLEEYKNARTKVLMEHKICNYKWKVKPQHFITSGSRCPNCSKSRVRTSKEFLDDLKMIGKSEFDLISEYINVNNKVKLKHVCGYEWDILPDYFFRRGLRCPKCTKNIRNKDLEIFKEEVYELVREEYEVLGDYIHSKEPILMKHNKCLTEYQVFPSSFLIGRRCPNCNSSKGEETIKSYLNKNNINFVKEYKFDDCRNKQKLKFDFAIFNNKNELQYLIEYDGSQHFSPKFGEDKLLYTQQNDSIKNAYCKNNNIKLIRIPYWDFSKIEEILKCKL